MKGEQVTDQFETDVQGALAIIRHHSALLSDAAPSTLFCPDIRATLSIRRFIPAPYIVSSYSNLFYVLIEALYFRLRFFLLEAQSIRCESTFSLTGFDSR